jgi:hypothetical protein
MREGPIRTISQIPIQIRISSHQALPIYQVLSTKIKELSALEMTIEQIAFSLNPSSPGYSMKIESKFKVFDTTG